MPAFSAGPMPAFSGRTVSITISTGGHPSAWPSQLREPTQLDRSSSRSNPPDGRPSSPCAKAVYPLVQVGEYVPSGYPFTPQPVYEIRTRTVSKNYNTYRCTRVHDASTTAHPPRWLATIFCVVEDLSANYNRTYTYKSTFDTYGEAAGWTINSAPDGSTTCSHAYVTGIPNTSSTTYYSYTVLE